MIKFSEEQKKVVTVTYELLCKYGLDKNEIEAIIFRGEPIYKILADRIYVLEDQIKDYNEQIEKYFENKDVLEMLKDNGKRQEMIYKLEENSKLLKDVDSVISILKDLNSIVNKIESKFEVEKVQKQTDGKTAKLSSEKNTEIKATACEPIISKETFDKANLNYKKQTNN